MSSELGDPALTDANLTLPGKPLAVYERWQPTAFDGKHSQVKIQHPAAPHGQQEYDQSYALKHEAAYASGMQQAQADAQQIHTLLQNVQIALNQIDEQVAQSLLDLALAVSRQMVREALQIKPEIILNVVSEAIGKLPHFNQNPHLILQPDDAELVRAQLGEQLSHANWKIYTDPQLQRGGCRVETAHSNVEASNEARWQHIVAAIGQDVSWLPK